MDSKFSPTKESSLVIKVRGLEPEERMKWFKTLSNKERLDIIQHFSKATGSPYGLFQDDPVGFVEIILGETLWSKQKEILRSLVANNRTCIASCHASGKSFVASRAVVWWASVYTLETAQVITTAPVFRQVKNILWPQIRKLAIQAGIANEKDMNQVEWKSGNNTLAYGFSASDHDEASVQGVHYPNLLIVVDEAGGIPAKLGNAMEAITTGDNTKMLLIGNPPTDEDNSWFETSYKNGFYDQIKISAYDTPNFTKEFSGICKSCPLGVPEHEIAPHHLVDQRWVEEQIKTFGGDSNFVNARVKAEFVSSHTNKVIPFEWVAKAQDNKNYTILDQFRLGVDIASDGGDELVIAEACGFNVKIVHRSSGKVNENAIDVANKIAEHIDITEAKSISMGFAKKIKVKLDATGMGWAVVDLLKEWQKEGRFAAEIIGVNVSEQALDKGKYANTRAEMWWNGRELLAPKVTDSGSYYKEVKIVGDQQTLSQLSYPTYKNNSAGKIQIESKAEMKRRGLHSPDRAEAILLALYEPKRKTTQIVAPDGIKQENQWKI